MFRVQCIRLRLHGLNGDRFVDHDKGNDRASRAQGMQSTRGPAILRIFSSRVSMNQKDLWERMARQA